MSRTSPRGFTLIELLIVVAIIAILAAIAVPNFLEAQTRAKVSRAKADMRSVATAVEAYCVDNGVYTPNPDRRENRNVVSWRLTTPIAFMTTLPIDPFKIGKTLTTQILDGPRAPIESMLFDYFTIVTTEQAEALYLGNDCHVFVIAIDSPWPARTWPPTQNVPSWANAGAQLKYGKWVIWSRGPDGVAWQDKRGDEYPDFIPYDEQYLGLLRDPLDPRCVSHQRWGYSFDIPYDSTNGTASFGNILRTALSPEGSLPLPPLATPGP